MQDPLIEKFTSLGIVDWGYTEEAKSESYQQFEKWIIEQKNFPLNYLSGERGKKRESLLNIFPSFQSATVFLFSYLPEKLLLNQSQNPKRLAGYSAFANGEDYHHVLHARCLELAKFMEPDAEEKKDFLICIDIYPVLERDLAYRAGLGWFGKNSLLISKKHGSFFLIASILWNQKIALPQFISKKYEIDHCGHCRKCIDACPTNAIEMETRKIIASKCIATYTIEMKNDEKIPAPLGYDSARSEIFGCDICQDVCPWNGKPLKNNSKTHISSTNSLIDFFLSKSLDDLNNYFEKIDDINFKEKFFGSNFFRTKRNGILKNIKQLLNRNFF